MKKILFGIMTALLLVVVVGCSAEAEGKGKSESNNKSQTITLGITPWTSTIPPTKIASLIIQDMGYKVKETSADAGNVYIGLSRGDIDVFMDSWLPVHDVYLEKYADKVEDTATSYSDVKSGLVVPNYMEDINSIDDLKGKEKMFKNEMFGIEEGASATKLINEMIEGYELDIKQVNSSEGGMLAQARRLMENKEPLIFYGWRPHSMFNKFDIKVLEDEKDFLGKSSVHVITNKELKASAPDVYKFLSNWSISIDDVEAMIVEIENEGVDPEDVARKWIENNQDKVNEMIGK